MNNDPWTLNVNQNPKLAPKNKFILKIMNLGLFNVNHEP